MRPTRIPARLLLFLVPLAQQLTSTGARALTGNPHRHKLVLMLTNEHSLEAGLDVRANGTERHLVVTGSAVAATRSFARSAVSVSSWFRYAAVSAATASPGRSWG
jgi:hypothetical protein